MRIDASSTTASENPPVAPESMIECTIPWRSSSLLTMANRPSGLSATPSAFIPVSTLSPAGVTMRPDGSTASYVAPR